MSNVSFKRNHIIFHLDLDMFYAAIEIRAQPEIEDLPVIVGNPNAWISNRGVVLTANYHARKFGVRSGMSMKEALQKCPTAYISNIARSQYGSTSERIMDYLRSYELPMKITSVDEAYLDVTSIVDNYYEASILAKIIQDDIFEQEQLTFSIGIAPTLRIAKIASDYDKPIGITVVQPEEFEEFFNNLPLIDIPGIGKKSYSHLKYKGYENCGQIFHYNIIQLNKLFGSRGESLFRLFKGLTSNEIIHRGVRKSISHESTFHGKPGDIGNYTNKLEKLWKRTHSYMVEKGFRAKTVTVKIRFNDFDTITRSLSFENSKSNSQDMFTSVLSLASNYLIDTRGIRLLGVRVSNLEVPSPLKNNIPLNSFF